MAKSSNRLEKLQQKQAAIAAQIKREQQKQKDAERKADTRRKIILGGLMLKALETDTEIQAEAKKLLATLKRTDDRALFDLPPLPQSEQPDNDNTDQGATNSATPHTKKPFKGITEKA